VKGEGRDPALKKSRRLLLKRSENLGDEQLFRLLDLHFSSSGSKPLAL